MPSGVENRAPLSDAFVRFVSDCLKVKPEVRKSRREEHGVCLFLDGRLGVDLRSPVMFH